jgi:hypothetical protein
MLGSHKHPANSAKITPAEIAIRTATRRIFPAVGGCESRAACSNPAARSATGALADDDKPFMALAKAHVATNP